MGVPRRPLVEIKARSTLRETDDGARVKKASSKQRAGADYNTRLEKGYFVKDGIFPQFLARRRTVFRSPRLSYFRTFWPIRGRQISMSVEGSGLDKGGQLWDGQFHVKPSRDYGAIW